MGPDQGWDGKGGDRTVLLHDNHLSRHSQRSVVVGVGGNGREWEMSGTGGDGECFLRMLSICPQKFNASLI